MMIDHLLQMLNEKLAEQLKQLKGVQLELDTSLEPYGLTIHVGQEVWDAVQRSIEQDCE